MLPVSACTAIHVGRSLVDILIARHVTSGTNARLTRPRQDHHVQAHKVQSHQAQAHLGQAHQVRAHQHQGQAQAHQIHVRLAPAHQAQEHQFQAHHMEIRGLGIIDIRALFGIHATRQQKRIEVMVRLQRWDEDTAYTRTGLDTTEVDLLGIKIPEVTIPLNAGKNITVISEVVAMNHLLKYAGIDSAAAFNQTLQDAMRPVHEYFEQDYE